LDPDNATAYADRGITHGIVGQLDDAIADFTKALELQPDLGEAYYNRGLAYEIKGDQPKANSDFDMAKKYGFNHEDC